MKSIVFLCDDARELGGVQRVLATLTEEFTQRGYRVTLISLAKRACGGFDYGGTEMVELFVEGGFHRLLQKPAIGNLHLRGRRLFRLRRWAYRRACATLRTIVEQRQPDAVIIFDTLMAEIAMDAHLHGRKVIIQFHNSFASLAGGPVLDTLRRVSAGASAFLALTDEDAREFERAGVTRCGTMPNPVSFYPQVVVPQQERERRVIAIGRLHLQKAFTMLVEAWALADRPSGWHLDIYGEGPERGAIEDTVRRLRLGDSVTIHEPTRHVEALLSQAAVFALSSRYEGLCMVALEALACGMPIASTRSGPGTVQLVSDCGLLSDIGDASAFAASLTRLMTDPGLRTVFAEAGRAKAKHYGVDATVSRWQSLIDDIPPIA